MIGSTTRLLVLMEELREIGPTTPDHKEEASVIRLNPAIRDRVKSGHRASGRRRDCFTLPTCSFARRGVSR